MADIYYQPSGKVWPPGLLLLLVGGAAAAGVLGAVYAYLILYIPFIYVAFLLTLGFGAGVGIAMAWLAHQGRVRSRMAGWGATLLVALAGVYVSWGIWVFAALRQEAVDVAWHFFLLRPATLLEFVAVVAEDGYWSIFGWTPSGFALWAVWAGEALLILAATYYMLEKRTGREAYCEKCDAWCERPDQPWQFGVAGFPDQLRSQLESKNLAGVKALGGFDGSAAAWTEFDLQSCARCGETNVLTVETVTLTEDDKGKTEEQRESIVRLLLLSTGETAELRRLASRPLPVTDIKS